MKIQQNIPQAIDLINKNDILDVRTSLIIREYIHNLKNDYAQLLIKSYRDSGDINILSDLFNHHNLVFVYERRWGNILSKFMKRRCYVKRDSIMVCFDRHQDAFMWLMRREYYDRSE